MRPIAPSLARPALSAALLATLVATSPVAAQVEYSVLDRTLDEIDRLVEGPGSSRSVAAGFINPAAWAIQDRGGLYLAWEDPADVSDISDFRGLLSLEHLGFGMKRLSREGRDWYDYTLGLSFGNRSSSFGVSYSWVKGRDDIFGDSERWSIGSISRWKRASLGSALVFDVANKKNLLQLDVGLRPLGPRWTLFVDTLGPLDDISTGAFHLGYGLQTHVFPGVEFGVRARDTGEFALRVNLALGELRPSVRYRAASGGDRVSTTYAVELGEGPHLGQRLWPRRRYPTVSLEGNLSYRNYRLFDDRPRFAEILKSIDGYADDRRVEGVVVNLSGLQASAANLWELRAQLAGLRARGKKVLIYCDRLSLAGYAMATVADELWMDPQGQLDLRGINFGRSYYRAMLDKIGVGVDEWRYFTYKSAAETFSRTSMSDADREQWSEIIQAFYAEAVDQILAARGLSHAQWDELVDEKGMLLAKEALELGLVDHVGTVHDLQKGARDAARRPSSDAHFAGLGTVQGEPIWRELEWGEPDRIAVLYAIGPCEMDSGIKGRELSRWIRKAREDHRVKALVLRADSPGGDPLPSDLVARELRETARIKPVIVSQGQVAGSGGYWISMDGDRIVASPWTITGSIGVIGAHFWEDGIGEKLGMDYDHVQIGEAADLMSGPRLFLVGAQIPHRPLTDEERQRVENVIRSLYGDFVQFVADARGMSTEQVDAVGQGRVWAGRPGLEKGLVDDIGGLWDAIEMAKERSGLRHRDAVELWEGPNLGLFDLGGLMSGPPLPFALRTGAARAEDRQPERPRPGGALLESLSPLERMYLETLLVRPGEPALLMEPVDLGELLPQLE